MTECVDVHYQKGNLKIVRGRQVLDDGDSLNMMS